MKATDCTYRFVLLFFACLLTFGMYFSFDLPGVLQHRLEGITNCTDNSTRYNETCVQCEGCLGMSSRQFNILYAIYAWTNAVVVIGAGVLVDRLGNRVGLLLFSFLCLLGTSLFAVGTMLKDTSAMFPLMLTGRLIFGSGGGALTVVQSTVTAYWFKNKELAFSFACKTAMSRVASVLNFFFTESFASHFGLILAVWNGAILCGVAFISAIIVSIMDVHGVKQLGDHQALQTESKKFKLSDIKQFTLTYWLLVMAVMFYYVSLLPFMADASLFVHQKYGYSPRMSSIIVGVVYDLSIVLVPIIGMIIDRIGKRGIMMLICSFMMIPVYTVLAFTHIHPVIVTAWLGITYAVASAVIWPSIPIVVKQSMLGTAMGVNNSIQMLGVGGANLVVGEILGKNNSLTEEERLVRWKYMMIFLMCTAIACFTAAVFVNISDANRGGILNQSRKQMMQSKHLETEKTISVEHSTEKDYNVSDENQPLLGTMQKIN
ncbi:major facilitator superfamily domain-containing protein 1-like [Mytilus trossulus]|uniref:major facilitator superfamily domain-containing protein 1-like n=1 Tax=Mytilus trossulus TaxID=6551 RepID=UPI003006D144